MQWFGPLHRLSLHGMDCCCSFGNQSTTYACTYACMYACGPERGGRRAEGGGGGRRRAEDGGRGRERERGEGEGEGGRKEWGRRWETQPSDRCRRTVASPGTMDMWPVTMHA